MDWEKKLQKELMDLRTRLMKITDSNQLALLGIKILNQAMDSSLESTEKVLGIIYQLFVEAKEAENVQDFKRWDELILAISNLYILNNINMEFILQEPETAYYLFCLGSTSGYLDAFNEGTKHSILIEKYFHSKMSKDFQKEKRWNPFQKIRERLLDEIRFITEEYYKNGGILLHNDVAKWFKSKPEYGGKYNLIPDRIILKATGEIAEKYGRKRGVRR